MSSRYGRLVPVLVALLALAFVITHTDLARLRLSLAHAPLGALVAFSAVMCVANCAADTFAMLHVFRWFGLRLRFFDLFTIRAATYTLAVINYHAGQLGIIGYLNRVGKVPLSRASGWVLFIVGVWVGLLLLLASGGALLGGPQAHALLPVLAIFAAGLVVYVAILLAQPRFLREPPEAISVKNRWGHPGRIARRGWALLVAVFAPLLEAGLVGHVRALIVRLPHLAILIVWHFFALRCFGIQVPFLTAVLFLPVVFAVASLPISVQGLGTSQLAAVFFFKPFVTGGQDGEAVVVAYSLSMAAISTIGSLLMGFLFLRRGASLGLSLSSSSPSEEGGPAA